MLASPSHWTACPVSRPEYWLLSWLKHPVLSFDCWSDLKKRHAAIGYQDTDKHRHLGQGEGVDQGLLEAHFTPLC